MQIWYNAFCPLTFSGQFYEKWVSVRERNTKLLLDTVMYIATTKPATSIITIEIVMCIMHRRKYHLHDWTETPMCIVSTKIITHIFAAETFTCINAAETSNCIIATETVTCIIATKRSTNINVAESTTNIIAIEPQNLHNCNRRWHLHNCCRKCQLHSSNRNCHLHNWLQKLSLAEMVPVRDPFSNNKEILWIRTKFKAK